MFFVFGINNQFKELNINQNIFCNVCGNYGHYKAFVTYMVFSIFFIPIIKWNKKYYLQTSCCDTVYEINKDTGKKLELEKDISIYEEDIIDVKHYGSINHKKICSNCQNQIEHDFLYCPICGKKL